MTVYGWDASNHDWDRGGMDLARARREGISLFTHKAAEGHQYYKDPYFKAAMDRAHTAGFPVVGAYFVNHPGSQDDQADWFVNIVNAEAPWWRDHPCFTWQIDAEVFSYMPRAPNVAEINAFGDRIVARTGCSPDAITVYAPWWLYGDTLGPLKFKNLWSSAYVNGSGPFKSLYPGDDGRGWAPYSGKTPTIWQYTSSAVIAGQSPCDANAIRVPNETALQVLLGGNQEEDDMAMTPAERAAFISDIAEAVYGTVVNRPAIDGRSLAYRVHGANDEIAKVRADIAAVPTADEIAAAVIAALPPAATGGVTVDQIRAAVSDVLNTAAITTTGSANG